ncbi:hypothetical protein HME9304_00833 [Flagellimonas maritima]|uniref:Uncharacterized protein n=1 Tax=Flagellimonas maritima TaxID=1383885 RepID=A0A2Z4LPY8_9FLAO|nr:hypothetical protein HME9304_00833 [Allomuricauda aurantiaca]
MKKLNVTQKAILISGIVGICIGIYGKWLGWEYKSYFIPLYIGTSFIWIAFLNTDNKCEYRFLKRIFKR